MIDDVAGALRITVEEEGTGRRIPNAIVSVTTKQPDGTTVTKEYTTDENGQIYIPNLPVGDDTSYRVTKIPEGYKLTSVGEETNVIIKAKEVTEKLEKIETATKPTEATTESTTEATTVTTEATSEDTTEPTTVTTEDPTEPTTEPTTRDPEDGDKGNLIITVLDEKTKQPVPNATVTVKRPDGTIGTYTTDENGQIILKNIPAGEYEITVIKVPEGYDVTTGKTEKALVEKGKTTSHTALISTSVTTESPNPQPGQSSDQRTNTNTSSVRTGDDTSVIPIIITMVLSLALIVTIIIRKKKMKK